MPPAHVDEVLRGAQLVCDEQQVTQAFDALAAGVSTRLAGREPLVLAVMLGGMIPAAALLQRLRFPLELDYVHATRYRGGTQGAELEWLVRPRVPLEGRVVLIVDDILDEGVTLAAIAAHCRAGGAEEVLTCVLVDKRHGRPRALPSADFTGLQVDDRYVFGCGMDYRGYLRNLPAIYAVTAPAREGA